MLGRALAGSVLTWIVRGLSITWRIQRIGTDVQGAAARRRGRLVAMWHGRLLLGIAPHRNRGYRVLVSPAGDGRIIRRVLQRFGFGTVDGSTNRRSTAALREMVRDVDAGATLVITPDGPRGPRHSMRSGIIWLARATGLPILPVGYAADRAWRLSTWDRFMIPKPFARVAILYGDPLDPLEFGSSGDLSAAVHERLLALESRGFKQLGETCDW